MQEFLFAAWPGVPWRQAISECRIKNAFAWSFRVDNKKMNINAQTATLNKRPLFHRWSPVHAAVGNIGKGAPPLSCCVNVFLIFFLRLHKLCGPTDGGSGGHEQLVSVVSSWPL